MIKFLLALLAPKKRPPQVLESPSATEQTDVLAHAEALLTSGHPREALPLYLGWLETHSAPALAHNAVGACYSDTGDQAKAKHHFDLAYALDDLHPAILANRAKMHLEVHQYDEAHRCLQRLASLGPDFSHLYAVHSSLCIARGEAELARRAALKAWQGNFDNLRTANCFLFNSAYKVAE